MTGLHLAPGLDLPEELVTQPCSILARRGAGKTYTASVMTEELLGAGLPVVVLDPLGVWWGLRASADGQGEGLPVTILGGPHGDVPLEATGGKVIAELVVDEPGGYILDLSLFESNAAQDRFAYEFADRLYRAQRRDATPLHLMVDEAHNFVPQNVRTGRGEGGIGPKMLGAFEALVRQGRARGLGCTLISQRPAVVNKNVLSQVEVLIAGQITGTIDRGALADWAKGWATKDQLTEFEGSLASLKVGDVWVWSPQWLELFGRFHIRERHTFDSSATPKVGEQRIEPRRLAPVDLEVVKERLAATIEKADAEDPKKLQARVRELEKQLVSNRPAEPERIVETIEVPVVPERVALLLESIDAQLNALTESIDTVRAGVQAPFEQIRTEIERSTSTRGTPASPPPRGPRRGPVVSRDTTRAPAASGVPLAGADQALGKAERAVLTVLAQHPGGRTKSQLALLSGYSVKSSSLANALGALRSAGSVTRTADPQITDAGLAALGDYEPLPTGPALRAHWSARLGRAERAVLDVLIDAYPNELTRDEIADASGYSPSSSSLANALGKLRSLDLVDGFKAADDFMDAIR